MSSSYQNPVGNSKAAKFVASNPLAPLANPFAGVVDDNDTALQNEVANNVQQRLEKAMETLKEKHRTGTNEVDDVDRAPTGAAYRALHEHQMRQAKAMRQANDRATAQQQAEDDIRTIQIKERMRRLNFSSEHEQQNADNHDHDNESNGSDDDDDDEDEFDHLLNDDDDNELQALRQARIAELKQQQSLRAQHVSLGHGSLRTITQDEFLPECTGSSKFVCVHYYHDDFERCKIMDYHLKIIASEHMEAKFLRIDAAKAPFFVNKLRIQTLPALLVFESGKEIGRLTGFDGLALDKTKPDEWHTGRLQEWIASVGAIQYEKPSREVEEECKRLDIVMRGGVYSDASRGRSGMTEDF
ncbi:hypothetical protein ACHAWU_003811 [Discostella pseudostelligera]|uniref:Phosducin domain-containing protein n=1 Tax=Discostella pseudostelligera TaxID=259834 RepID=A0ABD3MQ21_9STRA